MIFINRTLQRWYCKCRCISQSRQKAKKLKKYPLEKLEMES